MSHLRDLLAGTGGHTNIVELGENWFGFDAN
jgi:hypothetical protein